MNWVCLPYWRCYKLNNSEKIRAMLRAHEPFAKIRTKVSSVSKLYEVAGQHLDELGAELENKRLAVSQFEKKELDLETTVTNLEAEAEELEENLRKLREERDDLRVEVQSAREEVDALNADIEGLEKTGYTGAVLATLKNSWVKNGDEALEVLCCFEKAVKVRETVQRLSEEEAELKRSVKGFETRKQNIAEKVNSEKNRLDMLKAKVSALQESVSVVEAILGRGYTQEQLISVFDFLRMVEIQKEPGLSIRRLVECFGAAEDLSSLKSEILMKEKKLEELRLIELEVEERIGSLKFDYLGILEEQVEKEKEVIASVADKAKDEISRGVQLMAEKVTQVNEDFALYTFEKGKFEQLKESLEPVLALLGMSSSFNLLKAVSPSTVVALLENVGTWLEQRFPGSSAKAVYNPVVKEFVANPFASPIPVVAFSTCVAVCVRNLVLSETEGEVSL